MLLASGEEVAGQQSRYVIERMVGLGAYGAVYAAHDPQTPGRQIALKEFFPARHPRDQAPLQSLFDRERMVGMQASPHPLMPTFYEAFLNDSHYYIAQEFVVGSTLDEIIVRRHPLTREWILKWSVSLCDALAFLHAHQIVHHDLKPANIRITPQGHLVLLDFGAAQYFGAGHENDAPAMLYGTEGYLPPELEADGQWIADVRTDIFALGCVLYEMIAGHAPDQAQINERSLYVTNSLIQRPNADLGLVKLINKAISYNTEYRYPSAGAFLQEMREIAPPVMLVTKKNLRFGEITSREAPPVLSVTLYNAGGSEIKGAIMPRAPWIVVPGRRFTGNSHEIQVTIDPGKAMERDKMLTGKLEINSDDQTDSEGQIIAGDKWFVECSVTVASAPGRIEISGWEGAPTAPLPLSGRRGQEATGKFTIRNSGELPLDFRILPSHGIGVEGQDKVIAGFEISPSVGTLTPGQILQIAVAALTTDSTPETFQNILLIQSPQQEDRTIPLTLHMLSSFDYIKALLSGR